MGGGRGKWGSEHRRGALCPSPDLLPVPPLPQMPKILVPVLRKPANLQVRKRNNRQHLAANNQKLPIARASDRKCAPEPGALKALQFPAHNQPIPQMRGPPVIDLGSNHNWAFPRINHGAQWPAEVFCQQRTVRLDKAKIGNIMDDASSVGVEKHHTYFGFEARRGHLTVAVRCFETKTKGLSARVN